MKKLLLLAASIALIGAGCTTTTRINPVPSTNNEANTSPTSGTASHPSKDDLIVVESLSTNALVTSPLTVTGQARGTWYFEASFPVRVYDSNGKELAVGVAQAQGDWMTEEYVPFSVTLTFDQPTTDTGTLVLQKDNPSGLPKNENSLTIPVRFTN